MHNRADVASGEVGGPGEFDHMSDEELERELIERFKLLGYDVTKRAEGPITINGGALPSPSGDSD
jgi:hypothetical protein